MNWGVLDSIRYQALTLAGWPAWRKAASLEEIGALVIRWLDGQDRVLPWHMGPPDPETAEIREPLRALNLRGLVTTNSQPGVPLGADGWEQRAWVHLLASPASAWSLAVRAENAGLIVLCEGIRPLPHERVPITLRPDRRVNTSTDGAWEELFLPGRARAVARNAWEVTLIDPVWGRQDFLWETVTAP